MKTILITVPRPILQCSRAPVYIEKREENHYPELKQANGSWGMPKGENTDKTYFVVFPLMQSKNFVCEPYYVPNLLCYIVILLIVEENSGSFWCKISTSWTKCFIGATKITFYYALKPIITFALNHNHIGRKHTRKPIGRHFPPYYAPVEQ